MFFCSSGCISQNRSQWLTLRKECIRTTLSKTVDIRLTNRKPTTCSSLRGEPPCHQIHRSPSQYPMHDHNNRITLSTATLVTSQQRMRLGSQRPKTLNQHLSPSTQIVQKLVPQHSCLLCRSGLPQNRCRNLRQLTTVQLKRTPAVNTCVIISHRSYQ